MLDFEEKNFLADEESSSNEKRDLILFDQTDKPFLLLYLIVFILGIFLTVLAISRNFKRWRTTDAYHHQGFNVKASVTDAR